jgi:hypothetical protein
MRNVHYILSSHWDREWHQTFQDFRARLVTLLDRTLDALESGELAGPFTMDGQSIAVEDYLEIRPANRERVRRLVAEGKFRLGPWYVLPDEWIVSGESLVRNLRLGREIPREFGGETSHAGIVSDLFGHVSQMPQIFAGFGMRFAMVWRGIEPRPRAHFLWKSPDGTALPCYRFGRGGYCDFSFDVRHSHVPQWKFEEAKTAADARAFVEKEAGRTGIPPVLVFDGADHHEWDARYTQALLSAFEGSAEFRVIHSDLDQYLGEVLLHAGEIDDEVTGELRQPGRLGRADDQQILIPGILSSRVWIKQANSACQSLLCHWAEPLGAMAHHFLGREYPDEYLRVAWKWLLQNHPHDSICGCSIDEVHEDMRYRFAQCRQIAERQATHAAMAIAASVGGEIAPDEMRVVLFNPLPESVDQVVELALAIPSEWVAFNEPFCEQPRPAFRLHDPEGREIPYQRLGQSAARRLKKRVLPDKFPEAFYTTDVRVALRARLPPLGYTSLTVQGTLPVEPAEPGTPGPCHATRHPSAPSLALDGNTLQNAWLTVRAEADGTLTLEDRRSGQTYRKLLCFEDAADVGDGWCHSSPTSDRLFTSAGAPSQISLDAAGPELARLRIRTALMLPEKFDHGAMARSDALREFVIESHVTLRRDSDRVEVRVTVNNAVLDHRLRVLFPTGAKAETYFADSAFDVVERPIALPADNHLGRETAVETMPQQTWTAVSDASRGLAVVSTGLMESAVRDDAARTLALTLFRATRRTVFTDGECGGQLLGPMTFDFWLVPLSGAPDRKKLCNLGTLLAAGIRDVQLREADRRLHAMERSLPASSAFLQSVGNGVLTSCRWVGDALETRFFNPESADTTLVLAGSGFSETAEITAVDLESRPLAAPIPLGAAYSAVLPAKRIVTLAINTPPSC